jgi:hypothetical protein
MRMPAFTKSIHFKLTVWYSAILISLTILLIIGLNIAMHQASIRPPIIISQFEPGEHTPAEIFRLVTDNQLTLLRNYSIIGICCLTALGGVSIYFLSSGTHIQHKSERTHKLRRSGR